MDSLTHLALGAIIGEAYGGKALGKKAMAIGAISQCLPDIDFVLAIWLRPVDNLLEHRGFTHSILFCLMASVLLGLLTSKWQSSSALTRTKWILFFGLQISVHLILDAFNSYGVGWFEPFSHLRVAFDMVYVADPFFSIGLGMGCIALLILKKNTNLKKNWILMPLMISSLYLIYAFSNKLIIDSKVKSEFERQGISYSRFLTTPTPLNNWLWYVIAENSSGYYVGYRSVFDSRGAIDFTYFPRQLFLLDAIDDKEDLRKLKRFSRGYYTIEKSGDAILFNDLRFGQIAGWVDPRAQFAFHYDLLHPDANLFVVQQGRFSKWNTETVRILIRRIEGN